MEIITLVKANIRHKKGSFTSIIILMAIISAALLSMLSVQDDIFHSISDAHDRINTENIISMIDKSKLSDDLLDSIKNNKQVRDVQCVDTIPADQYMFNGKEYSGNTAFMQELKPGYRLFRQDGKDYLSETPELKQGECYISRGMQTNISCELGDHITITTSSGDYDLKIAGIIEEPMMGAAVIGWKNIYISHEDYKKIYQANQKLTGQKEGVCTIITQMGIYKAEACDLSDNQFARQLNLDTGFADMSYGTSTREQSIHYTYLFPEIICSILMAFVLLLFVVVIVVMCHSISSGIEMEYATLGVMKSQGFSKGKIRIIYIIQYLMAQIIGVLLGIVPAVPLGRFVGNVFSPITGILSSGRISVGKYMLIISCVFLISILCMMVITGKIAKISPVRAISGGKAGIWFDSRLRVPISQRALSPSLALRQFTSNKRQYISIIIIVSILVYFMVTMMVLGNLITAKSAWESMGFTYSDVNVNFRENADELTMTEIEGVIEGYSGIESSWHSCGNYYFSINGEQVMACIWGVPEEVKAIIEGRIPLYDNEIVLTEITADNMGLEVGDKVTVGYRGRKEDYIISGLNQYLNDAGNNFSMTKSAASKLYEKCGIMYIGYTLEDRSVGQSIADELNEKYGDILEAAYVDDFVDEIYQIAINAMTAVVYAFSIIFAVVVVHMVCTKAFLRERRDIGIFKAVGFTSGRLRLQFAVRFLIVAVLGSVIGSVLAAAFSEDMLSLILRMMGISDFNVPFHVMIFALPVVLICVCFFVFAYFAARKIKKVEVKELVVE